VPLFFLGILGGSVLVALLRWAGGESRPAAAPPRPVAAGGEDPWPVRPGQLVAVLPFGCWGIVRCAARGPREWVVGVELRGGRPAALRLSEIVR